MSSLALDALKTIEEMEIVELMELLPVIRDALQESGTREIPAERWVAVLAQEIADSWQGGGDPEDAEEVAALIAVIEGHVERGLGPIVARWFAENAPILNSKCVELVHALGAAAPTESALDKALAAAFLHLQSHRSGTAIASTELRRHARRLESGQPGWGELLDLLADAMKEWEREQGADHETIIYAKTDLEYRLRLGPKLVDLCLKCDKETPA